ncbi:MAG: aminopeptidase N [Methylotenera sp.]|nr:aminopeptidase N [Oligoflexia bacterium]
MKFKTPALASAVALGLTLTMTSCSSTPTQPAESAFVQESEHSYSAEQRKRMLTREQAMVRSKQIQRVSYNLWFDLDNQHEDFQGRTVINFEVREKYRSLSKDLLLDFSGGAIKSVTVNSKALTAEQLKSKYDGDKFKFSMSDLSRGANRIEIAYSHPYSKDGRGIHRFKDPVDHEVYLYSDFEPYDAHLAFPCFDQPDLKASYELTVEAPPEWEVIGNMAEREVSNVDGRRSWQFPPSPVFSTYVFALHAGPYKSWKGDANGIPLRLFARQSLAQYVDAKEWLETTQQGLEFYNTYFGFPYPYSKYDQIIVPDFNAGAMENVGAVTFSEHFIFRSKVIESRKRSRADTILHEMAHMWFGDLVTMRWWNGLWLNESFATFMAAKAIDEGTSFKGSWQDFFAGEKVWAYREDQLVTTHPIEVSVHDTESAFSNFDGITYGKGASVLKQLSYYISDEDFREGLQRYFIKFANRNTTLADFIKKLSEASALDLSSWQKSWLQTSGVNTLEPVWECDADQKISKFLLRQAEGVTLRPHKTLVAFYRREKGGEGALRVKEPVATKSGEKASGSKTSDTFTVEYSKAETEVPDAIGKPCPAFVFPNEKDYDYVKVVLDAKSLGTVKQSLSKIEDPLTRQMLWHTLWEMVRDGKLKAQDYADIAFQHMTHEKDTKIIEKILGTLSRPGTSFTVYKVLIGQDQVQFANRLEKMTRAQLLAAPAGSDLQLLWFQGFVTAARSDESLKFLSGLLSGKQNLKGFKVEQERRWEIIRMLARNADAQTEVLIAAELKADNTDMGQKQAIMAEASVPQGENKAKWFRIITRQTDNAEEKAYNLSKLSAAMNRFHLSGQEEFSSRFVEPFFDHLAKVMTSETDEYLSDFSGEMYPAICDQKVVDATTAFLKKYEQAPATVVKHLKVMRQEEERCLKVKAYSQNSAATRS